MDYAVLQCILPSLQGSKYACTCSVFDTYRYVIILKYNQNTQIE